MRNQKGITLVLLAATVLIMITILGTITYTSLDNFKIDQYYKMCADIELLDGKISLYYLKHKDDESENFGLPIDNNKIRANSEFESIVTTEDNANYNPNNIGELYKIDLSKLQNLTLNHDGDFFIDKQSHTVYYSQGYELEGDIYYTIPKDYQQVDREAILLEQNIEDDNEDTNVTLNIGDYVEYAVTYEDMSTEYEFSSQNGWRVLDTGTKDENTNKYTGVKLISTGIPVKLNYSHSTNMGNVNNGWWGTDAQVSEIFGSSHANGYTNNINDYCSAGLRQNFRLIPFSYGNSANANEGFFKKVNNKTTSFSGDEFLISSVASEIHNLTLEELNRARNANSEDVSTTQNNDAAPGLFCLLDLSQYDYTSSTECYYWLASPNYASNYYIWIAYSLSHHYIDPNQSYGLRPVITLKDNIKFVSTGDNSYRIK